MKVFQLNINLLKNIKFTNFFKFQMNCNNRCFSNLQINNLHQNVNDTIFPKQFLNQNILNLNYNIPSINEKQESDIIDDIKIRDNQINIIKENMIEKSLEDEEYLKDEEMIKNNNFRDLNNSEILDNENYEDENENDNQNSGDDNLKKDYINKRNKIEVPEIQLKGRNSRMPSKVSNFLFEFI